MKPVNNQIIRNIPDDLTQNQVSIQAKVQVQNQVEYQVWDQVWIQVFNQVDNARLRWRKKYDI